MLPPEAATPEAVRDATARVLDDPAYGLAAATLQREIERMPPPEQVLAELVARAAPAVVGAAAGRPRGRGLSPFLDV